jgi:broad specificity phosphatase PhoE
MTTIYLIRHGQAEAGWNLQHDPGLSDTGRQQAYAAASALADRGPLPIIVSPLRRTRETAHEFELKWRRPALVDGRVTEIPSQGMTLEERGEWLKTVVKRRWDDLDEVVRDWRRTAIQSLLEISRDTVVVTHFMVVNAVVSWTKGDERVVSFHPLPGSRTTLERVGDSFKILELGGEGASTVL